MQVLTFNLFKYIASHQLLLWLCFSLARSFQESYIESGGTSSSFCNKIFASWDFCICDENTAKVKSQNIVQTIRVSVTWLNEHYIHVPT